MFVKGKLSLTVCLFNSLRSVTHLICPSFFFTDTSGDAHGLTELAAMPMCSPKVQSLLALTTHRSDQVNYLSGSDSTVSLVIYMERLLELDKFSSLNNTILTGMGG